MRSIQWASDSMVSPTVAEVVEQGLAREFLAALAFAEGVGDVAGGSVRWERVGPQRG